MLSGLHVVVKAIRLLSIPLRMKQTRESDNYRRGGVQLSIPLRMKHDVHGER